MSVKFSNNATTELASSIGTSDTSITVVDGSKFPILTAGDHTYVTLDTDTASPTREIVRVTAISGNVLTVTRGQDGTSPASFAAGTKVELRLTAALLNDVAGANPSGEPIGFPDKSQTTITFDSGIRTFSITPTGASFDVYCKGVKYTYTTVQLVTIPNTTGLHFIYFSASGVLSTQMSYFTWEEHAPTAYVYWNATTQQAIYFGDERHGITLDWQTHEYLHRTRGAAIANGFAASGYTTTGLGATDADAQIDIGGGTFFDEDMQVDIVSTNTPVAGTWQQDLSGPARIPVMYLSGAAWVIDSPTNFPFKVISSVPQYNLLSGSTWSTAGVTNNSYFVSWILATNNLTYPVISIISQAPTNQLSIAEAMTFEGLNLNGFPSVEFRPLYKVIYQYKDNFANSVKSSTIAVYDLRSISSAGVAAALVQDHGNLSGLTDDDHPQYVHTSEVRTPSAAVKNSFFPSQVGQTGKYLSTNGTNTVWEPAPSGSLSFTGDVTGTGSTGSSVAMTLAASGVVAGQYTKVTVDSKGRVTAGTGVTSADVTSALGYTPYNATNPAGYTTNVGTVTSVSGTGTVSGLTLTGSVTSSGSLTLGGTLSLTSGQVTTALGFTPYNATNPSGYITGNQTITISGDASGSGATSIALTLANSGVAAGTYTKVTVDAKGRVTTGASLASGDLPTYTGTITSGQVTTALGYTPYNATNPSGYITGITSGMVTTALGYTPYNATNPSGYITSSYNGFMLRGTAVQSNPNTNFVSSAYRFDPNANNPTNTYYAVLTYGNESNVVGQLATHFSDGTTYTRAYNSVWSAWRTQLDSINYSSYALPLSGGTLTGTLTGTTGRFQKNQTAGDYTTAAIWAESYGNTATGIAFHISGNVGKFLEMRTNGLLYFNSDLLLHSGNYTSYSPSLTGSGASGTWSISITGSAGSASNSTTVGGLAPAQFFNNMGNNHSTYTDFNNVPGFGAYYVQQGGNSPTGTASHQWYGFTLGLGNDYALGSYGSQIYYPRRAQNSDTYIYVRDREGGSWTSWTKIRAGVADSLNFGGGYTVQMGDWGLRNTTPYGWIQLGPANTSHAHIYTDRSNFYFNAELYTSGYLQLHSNNYSSYALPLSGGTLTGTIYVGTSGSGSNVRALRVGPSGGSPASFGSYTGSWRSTIEIWDNAATRMLHLTPPDGTNYNYSSIKSTDAGLRIDVGGSGGTNAIDIGTNGVANFPQGLQQGGNQVLHAGNWTSYTDGRHTRKDTTGQYLKPFYEYGSYLTSETPANLRDQMGGGGLRVDFLHPSYTGSGGWNHVITWSGYNVYNMYQLGGHYDGGTGTDLWVRSEANHGGTSWTAWRKLLNSSNYNSYAPTLTGGGASGTWSINITGSAGSASSASSASSATALGSSGYGSGNHTWRQDSGSFAGYSGWASYMINNHGDGATYYNQTLIMPFWSAPQYSRLEGGTFRGPYIILSTENYNSYAPTLTGGNASGTWGISISGTAARATRANGNLYIDDNYGNGVVGVYASTRYQGVFAMGDSYKLPADGTTTGSLYGMAWSHPNAGGAAGNLDSHGMLVLINGGFGSCMSYSIKASGNVTAYSDERLKTNWRPMPTNYVERLASVKVGIYDRTDGEQMTQVGVSAQSFQELLPEAITKAGDEMGTLSVSYGNAAMASAVELAKELVMLKRELAEIKSRLH